MTRFYNKHQGVVHNHYENVYLSYLRSILETGRWKDSRPGIRTLSSDEQFLVFDISNNLIPMPTTRELSFKNPCVEMLWFLSGSKNVAFLKKNNVSIWDDWVIPRTAVFEPCEDPPGQEMLTWLRCKHPDLYKHWKKFKADNNIGQPTRKNVSEFMLTDPFRGFTRPKFKLVSGEIGQGAYGPMWRQWPDLRALTAQMANYVRGWISKIGTAGLLHDPKGAYTLVGRHIDQLQDAVDLLRNDANSRRIIVSAWNPAFKEETVLMPCHSFYQFISYDNGPGVPRDLTLHLYQRSADAPVGSAVNIPQYALLAHMVAHITGHRATKFVLSVGDAHIYEDQIEGVKLQIERKPFDVTPQVVFEGDIKELKDFNLSNVKLAGFEEGAYHPAIKYPVAV